MIPEEVRIFACTEPTDMRFGFDRLAAAVRERVGQDPLAGGLYIFANRGATRLKLLWFDRNGLCVLYKQLHQAAFELPLVKDGSRAICLDRAALGALWPGSTSRVHCGAPRATRCTEKKKIASKMPVCPAPGVTQESTWGMAVEGELEQESPARW